MKEGFYVPDGFKADRFNLSETEWKPYYIRVYERFHNGTHIEDLEVEFRFSIVVYRKLTEVLREEGYYRKDLYMALKDKFGKKMDAWELHTFLEQNRLYHRISYIKASDNEENMGDITSKDEEKRDDQ